MVINLCSVPLYPKILGIKQRYSAFVEARLKPQYLSEFHVCYSNNADLELGLRVECSQKEVTPVTFRPASPFFCITTAASQSTAVWFQGCWGVTAPPGLEPPCDALNVLQGWGETGTCTQPLSDCPAWTQSCQGTFDPLQTESAIDSLHLAAWLVLHFLSWTRVVQMSMTDFCITTLHFFVFLAVCSSSLV